MKLRGEIPCFLQNDALLFAMTRISIRALEVRGLVCYLARMPNPTLSDTPQFTTAEYAGTPGADRCKSCNQTIGGSYYRLNGATTCPACVERMKQQIPQDSPAAFTRALVFGIGGAILGLILYAAFTIITRWIIRYVSLAVGYIVGKAIKMGSGGIGGRRYQIAALALTYAAVSMAAVPIWVSQVSKARKAAPRAHVQLVQPPSGKPSTNTSPAQRQTPATPAGPARVGVALIMLVLVGLASPFLELAHPIHGMIGLVILFVGIRIAWQIARGTSVQILGPFHGRAPVAS